MEIHVTCRDLDGHSLYLAYFYSLTALEFQIHSKYLGLLYLFILASLATERSSALILASWLSWLFIITLVFKVAWLTN